METLRGSISDYTEQEFLQLVTDICEVNCQNEEDHSVLVRHFRRVSEHPGGSDLIFILLTMLMTRQKES